MATPPSNTPPPDRDDEFTKSLQDEVDRLNKDNKALTEEFANDPNALSSENIVEKLRLLVPHALTTLEFLMMHSPSPQIRANLCKFVIDATLKQVKAGDNPDNELAALLAQLKGNDHDPR